MADINSPETIELLERRLADSVGDRVEKALKYRYAAVVAAALGVLSLSGWSLIDNVVAKSVGPLLTDAQKNIAQINLQLELAKDQKVRLDSMLDQIETRAAEGQKRLDTLSRQIAETQGQFDATLANLQDQFGAVVVRRREVEADLELNRRLIDERLDQVQGEIVALARLGQSLAALDTAGDATTLGAIKAEAARIATEADAALGAAVKASVFVQYGQAGDADTIQALAADLRKQGYVVPRAERQPIANREIRYFWPDDLDAANTLAADTRRALRKQGFGDVDIAVKDFTTYPKAKPRQGTLELWLPLPARS